MSMCCLATNMKKHLVIISMHNFIIIKVCGKNVRKKGNYTLRPLIIVVNFVNGTKEF
jgi:hypothetical protein